MIGLGPVMHPPRETEAVLPNQPQNLNLENQITDEDEGVAGLTETLAALLETTNGRTEDAGVLAQLEEVNGHSIEAFDLLRARPARPELERLPRGLRIVLWNCRGVGNKQHLPGQLLMDSGADLLVLNETMRSASALSGLSGNGAVLVKEATRAQVDGAGRNASGVAILAARAALKPDGTVQGNSELNVDNVHGTKVVVKINDFVIFAVYCPPNASGYRLLIQYAEEAAGLAQSQPVIFCGDLNIDVSADDPSSLLDKEREFLAALGPAFRRVDTGDEVTRPANRQNAVNLNGRTLDHFFVANADHTDGKVLLEYDGISDHRPVMVSVSLAGQPSPNSTKYWRLRLEKLKDAAVKDAYVAAISEGIGAVRQQIRDIGMAHHSSPLLNRLDAANRMEKTFSHFILSTAKRVIGRKRVPLLPGPVKAREPSSDYRVALANFKLTNARILSLEEEGTDPARLAWLRHELEDHRQALNAAQLADNRRASREFEQMLHDLPAAPRLKVLNRMKRRRAAVGQSLASSPAALVAYHDHFKQQYTNEYSIADEPLIVPSLEEIAREGNEIFDETLVRSAIERSPLGKAPGMTGICAELLVPAAAVIADTVDLLFRFYFAFQVVPSSWTRSLICPVPKKGDLSLISNYRPISLTEVLRKIFEVCLLDRLKSQIPLSCEQGGFRDRRSCYDQIEALQLAVKKLRSGLSRPHLAFLDIKAAYDSVPRGELWRRLKDLGVPTTNVGILRALFDHNSAQLVVGGKRCPPFALSAGVLQGSVLSPLLYSAYLDPLVTKLRTGPLIQYDHFDGGLNCLLYADDIVLIGKNGRHLSQLLATASGDSVERGYRFSPSKCAVISNSRMPLKLYGNPVPRVKSFCYLGIDFTATGVDEIGHAKRRVAKAEASVKSLTRLGARSSVLSARSLVHLFKTIVRPGLEYGLPLLTTKKGALVILDCAQLRLLKLLLNLPKLALNDYVHAISACPPLSVRQVILRHSRQEKLRGRWSTEWWIDDVLVSAMKGWVGEDFQEDPSLPRPGTEKLVLLNNLFIEPTNQLLRSRFDGELSYVIVQKLTKLKVSPGIFRLLSLWIVRSWRNFKTRVCKKCSQVGCDQFHVITCTRLGSKLETDPLMPPYLPLDTPRPRSESLVVEERIRAIVMKQQPRDSAVSQLEALGQHILSSLADVYGPLNRLTYA